MSENRNKILIAEDDRDIIDLLRLYLEKDGYEVIAAEDGLVAMDLLQDEQPDLVICDIMMPGMNGRDVCKFIRNKYDVPVIFLTALGDEEDIITGYEIGADEISRSRSRQSSCS